MMLAGGRFPVPPSANKLYSRSNKQGSYVYKSAEYKQWLEDISFHFERENWTWPGQELDDGPYQIWINVNVDRRRDIDNIIKPILDALQLSKIIKNDNRVDMIQVSRYREINIDTFNMTIYDSKP